MKTEDLIKHQKALEAKFGTTDTIAYPNVSSTQLSIARHYGGATIQGGHYIYFWEDDILVRDDVVAFVKKQQKPKTHDTPDATQTHIQETTT